MLATLRARWPCDWSASIQIGAASTQPRSSCDDFLGFPVILDYRIGWSRVAQRQVSIPASGFQRLMVTFSRALRRRCPYCGARGVFDGWFTLRKRCPGCNTLYEYEDGYFLVSYVVNLGVTELLTVGIVVWLIAGTDLSVLQMQVLGVVLAVLMPVLFYPLALLLWVALDISIHPPGDFSQRLRK